MASSLLKSAGRAAAWSALANWFGLLGGLVSLVVLARLLSPTEFGIYGMVLVALALPETIACNSQNESLIQREKLSRQHANAIFYLSLALATVFFIIIQLIAPLAALAFDEPRVTPMFRVMSFALFIGAFTSVPAALLQRQLKFRKIMEVDVIGILVGAVVGITLAILLKSAWALVWMELIRRFVRMLAFNVQARWWPTRAVQWQALKDLAPYNLKTTAIQLIKSAETMVPRAMVGAWLGPAALGIFNLALRIMEQLSQALVLPLAGISLAVTSRAQKDFPTLHKAIEGGMRLASLFGYPAFIGMAVIAPALIPIVFGDEWQAAVPAAQIALLMGLCGPTSALNAGILKGVGRPGVWLKIQSFSLAITLILIPFIVRYGLEAVMLTLLAQRILVWIIGATCIRAIVRFPLHRQFVAVYPAMLAALVMGTVVYAVYRFTPADWGPTATLILPIAVGMIVYVIAFAAVSPRLAVRFVKAARLFQQGDSEGAKALIQRQRPVPQV